MTPERKRALRAQIDQDARDMQGFQDLARENMRQWGIAISRAEKAEAERDDALTRLAAAEGRVAALRHAITEASDPDFIWGAMDNVHDAETTMDDYAAAVSRAVRGAMQITGEAE